MVGAGAAVTHRWVLQEGVAAYPNIIWQWCKPQIWESPLS